MKNKPTIIEKRKVAARRLRFRLAAAVFLFLLILQSFVISLTGSEGYVFRKLSGAFGISDFPLNACDYELSVSFVDVGKADCILIRSEKSNIMIDCGEYSLEGKALDYLKKTGTDRIDVFIASHTDSDHIGDFASVADNITIGDVWLSGSHRDVPAKTEDERILFDRIKEHGIDIFYPEEKTYKIGDMILEVLSSGGQKTENNNSLVIRMRYKEITCLFTGDAEKQVEKKLLSSGKELKADVYKIAHHGSNSSTTEAFLKAVSPECAVITSDSKNKYLPSRPVTDRLREYGCRVLRTDKCGTIIMGTDGKRINILTEKTEGEK